MHFSCYMYHDRTPGVVPNLPNIILFWRLYSAASNVEKTVRQLCPPPALHCGPSVSHNSPTRLSDGKTIRLRAASHTGEP